MNSINFNSSANSLENVLVLQQKAYSLKKDFIKAGFWFLELTRELDEEIKKWQQAAEQAFSKDPNSYRGKRYLEQVKIKENQRQRISKFYELSLGIITQYENELLLKEQTEMYLIFQIIANKKGLEIDVLNSVTTILRQPKTTSENTCQ